MEHNVTSWFVPNLNLLLMQKKNKCQCNPHPVHIIKQLAVCDIIASNDDPNGRFLKQGHPQIINVNRIFHYKPTIFGVPIYGNPRILISNHQPEPDITTPGTSEHLEQKCEPHTHTRTHTHTERAGNTNCWGPHSYICIPQTHEPLNEHLESIHGFLCLKQDQALWFCGRWGNGKKSCTSDRRELFQRVVGITARQLR